MQTDSFGVLYVAIGEQHLAETEQSAASVRRLMPDVPIAVWTDSPDKLTPGLFQHVMPMEKAPFSWPVKIACLQKSPFYKTLFLDTDTILIEPIGELEWMMDSCDFAYCHAPRRKCCTRIGCGINPAIPDCFVEANAGVLLYKATDLAGQFFTDWLSFYQPGHCGDQVSLREALYRSKGKMTVLPSEYNYRTVFPAFAGANLKVRILHGRGRSLQRAIKYVNAGSETRVANYAWEWFSHHTWRYLLVCCLKKMGIHPFLKKLKASLTGSRGPD